MRANKRETLIKTESKSKKKNNNNDYGNSEHATHTNKYEKAPNAKALESEPFSANKRISSFEYVCARVREVAGVHKKKAMQRKGYSKLTDECTKEQ